ncbi:glycosyltransferase family 1 protein [Gemmatimonas sp.]|uniref:glycosyltransferase family 4 protein n=1 Tax=Gemmatimonas sp. TaxID=1962908 RepID=UPI00286A9381|nr:glycosyltransferase family 1 protein [Gemmatimonas sp.]
MPTNTGASVRADGLRLALFTDTYAPQVNGVARTLERLVAAVEARGGVVRVFAPFDPEGQAHDAVERFGSRAFWAYPQLRLSWPSSSRVEAALAAFTPTLVHAATEFGVGLAGRRAAHALGIPFVSSYHTSFVAYAEHYRLGLLARPGWHFMRWFHNGGLRTYCPSQSIVEEVNAHGFERTAVWSRGVDGERFAPRHRSSALRERLVQTKDTLVLSYVGRLAAEKGLDVALDALERVERARPGRVRWLVVGDGPYEAEVRRRAPQGTVMTGKLQGPALSEAYASGDVFLFPSTTDTFGNVMLEAMASGLPVIGADVGPTREQLQSGGGWLVPPGDAAAFARTIVALVDDRALVRDAARRASTFAASKSWDVVWESLLRDYVQLHRVHAPPSLR